MEREIPKVIHYCWFGGNPLPELAQKCIASWKQYLPEYEIKEWNEQTFDVKRIPYTREAYRAGKYAHVSDYARFWILYHYGGLYFDTDVEVIRPLDDIIADGPFLGFECQEEGEAVYPEGLMNPGLGMGAPAGHPYYRKVLDFYEHSHFARWNGRSTGNVPVLTTRLLDFPGKEVLPGGIVSVSGLRIYPEEYFCPRNYYTGEMNITANTRTIHHYMASWNTSRSRWDSLRERMRFVVARLRSIRLSLVMSLLLPAAALLTGCSGREAVSEYDRTEYALTNEIEGYFSPQQWWRTAVRINLNLTTNSAVRIWLTSGANEGTIYDYKEADESGVIQFTAPQGYENPLYLTVYNFSDLVVKPVLLSGKTEETISVAITRTRSEASPATRSGTPPASLCGNSINGNPRYYEFNTEELVDYRAIMELVKRITNAKESGLTVDYELTTNGPFYITWVDGYEAAQKSRILGYYYHSPDTYEDIVYEDICETHKWDYIDGLAKVQYQFDTDIDADGHHFSANVWYDANFDMFDSYGSTYSLNMDRIGDDRYNSQIVYNTYGDHISAYQGISFEINVPKNKRIGFYLRSDEEPLPEQWRRLQTKGIKPYTNLEGNFKGTCFSVEDWNVDGTSRSFIFQSQAMTWIGMEDNVIEGDNDCNDVVFGLVGDLSIEPPVVPVSGACSFPWTIAYEDVYRGSDYDFNDAVIKLVPDYLNETCHVTVMAAGCTERMFLMYDGPEGTYNLGEIHQLLIGKMDKRYINTQETIASTPFVRTVSVPWPCYYTVANDARRFYIEIDRGTCEDCKDMLTLPLTPGEMPEAILVAGEWNWPMEGTAIYDAYLDFPGWAKDVTRTRYWTWYHTSVPGTFVSY